MRREQRTHWRHSISIEAMVETSDGRRLPMRVCDISYGGAFLKKADPSTPLPSLGTEVRITIRYQTEHGTEAETVAGRVVRLRPDGLAVLFFRETDTRSGGA